MGYGKRGFLIGVGRRGGAVAMVMVVVVVVVGKGVASPIASNTL